MNTNICMNWYLNVQLILNNTRLKSLVKRAFLTFLKTQLLNEELNNIKEIFNKRNDYPIFLVDEIIENRNLEKTSNKTEHGQIHKLHAP